ncbi:hypothetical protein C7476_101423 [Phyllobacterium bourgognense]|uniref:Uncharacterized protein n=1 Tax=Phyllobacterium bourgognense TaxID=314236 RepID=A0A368Z5C8_9HYPH|nr:hypothetical protein C7476_101423 [Phyllobacterium bourgognense]
MCIFDTDDKLNYGKSRSALDDAQKKPIQATIDAFIA